MKIPASIRKIYDEQRETNTRLQQRVDEILRAVVVQRKWHYESRIKGDQSVALKIESGRISDPSNIEDFFACTIAVHNLSKVDEAEALIRKLFNVVARRPSTANRTRKPFDSFRFDDLRLYVTWKDDPALPPSGLESIKFEIQIKTFLQHAWGIATHDLVYKTDNVSWSLQRIAFQIKAMLEHAEISNLEANRLAATTALAKLHDGTEELKSIIDFLKTVWEPELLPSDLSRLAENTRNVMRLAGINLTTLKDLLDAERLRLKGTLPVNISPYAVLVQAVVWRASDEMKNALTNRNKERLKLVVTPEMDTPEWMSAPEIINVIRVPLR
jgi:ppGpp synthetase/RelA/SpoT-type nucleotidyltranferase